MSERASAVAAAAESAAGSLAGETSPPRLRAVEVTRSFRLGGEAVPVLRGVSFALEPGEALAVTGPSGSGKSTLLHVLGTLDAPDSGRVEIDGRDPSGLAEPELARFRNRAVGFVFQEHYLLPQYTVLENVLLPALAFPGDRAAASARARELVERVGLGHRLRHRPAELSGGERQRVAVARALVNRPGLLLCDEPTGSLDRESAAAVVELLFELHRAERAALVVVTHDEALAARFGRRGRLADGRLVEERPADGRSAEA
jgi:lipoprotein-releasing system ATP-binding protein